MAKKTKTEDDLGLVPVVDATRDEELGLVPVSNQQNPYDIQAQTADAVSLGAGSPAQGKILEGILKKTAALYGGAGQGLSYGYGEKYYPEAVKQSMRENPGTSMLGQLIGGIPTGAAPELGLAKLGMEPGIIRGLLSGAVGGAAYNPGESSDPTSQRIINGTMGGVASSAMGGIGNLGRAYKTYKELGKPGTADTVMNEINTALESATENGFREPARGAARLMAEGSVEVNPDQLRGITPAMDRYIDKRIYPRLGEITKPGIMGESVSAPGGNVNLPGKEANMLRKYLDKVADFRKSKLYASPNALNEPAEAAAGMLRRKTQAINPEIERLQNLASSNKSKIESVERATHNNPIGGLTSDELGTRGSVLSDIDQMAGSKLKKLVSELKAGKALDPSLAPQSFYRPAEMAVRSAGLVGGAAAEPFTRYAPPGSKQSFINLLLEMMRPQAGQ